MYGSQEDIKWNEMDKFKVMQIFQKNAKGRLIYTQLELKKSLMHTKLCHLHEQIFCKRCWNRNIVYVDCKY